MSDFLPQTPQTPSNSVVEPTAFANWSLNQVSLRNLNQLQTLLYETLHPVHLRLRIIEFIPTCACDILVRGRGDHKELKIRHVPPAGKDREKDHPFVTVSSLGDRDLVAYIRFLFGVFRSDITRQAFLLWRNLAFRFLGRLGGGVGDICFYIPKKGVRSLVLGGNLEGNPMVSALPLCVERVRFGWSLDFGRSRVTGEQLCRLLGSEVVGNMEEEAGGLSWNAYSPDVRRTSEGVRKRMRCVTYFPSTESFHDCLVESARLLRCMKEVSLRKTSDEFVRLMLQDEGQIPVRIRRLPVVDVSPSALLHPNMMLDNIRSLNLVSSGVLTDDVLTRILDRTPSLKTLNVCRCAKLWFISLVRIVCTYSSITTLLYGFNFLRDFSVDLPEEKDEEEVEGEGEEDDDEETVELRAMWLLAHELTRDSPVNTSLRKLSLEQCAISDSVLLFIRDRCARLDKLLVSSLSPELFLLIHEVKSLRSFDCALRTAEEAQALYRGGTFVSPATGVREIEVNPELVSLELWCGSWNPELFHGLPRALRYLEVHFGYGEMAEQSDEDEACDEILLHEIGTLRHLRVLGIEEVGVSNEFISKAFSVCPSLMEVRVWNTERTVSFY